MIPRKAAKRLIDEVRDRIEFGDDAEEARFILAAEDTVGGSDLVLRGAENVEQKARRYLTEGRVVLDRVDADGGLVVASARGSGNEIYHLGYDPARKEWRCTCRVSRGRCAHLTALRLIVGAREAKS